MADSIARQTSGDDSCSGPIGAKAAGHAAEGVDGAEALEGGGDDVLGGGRVGQVGLDHQHLGGHVDAAAVGGGADVPALRQEAVEHGPSPAAR